jgi:hypothetical protein
MDGIRKSQKSGQNFWVKSFAVENPMAQNFSRQFDRRMNFAFRVLFVTPVGATSGNSHFHGRNFAEKVLEGFSHCLENQALGIGLKNHQKIQALQVFVGKQTKIFPKPAAEGIAANRVPRFFGSDQPQTGQGQAGLGIFFHHQKKSRTPHSQGG